MNFGLLSSFSISLGDLELATDYVNNEDSNLSSEVDTIKQTVFNKPATKKSKRAIIKPEITHEKLMKKFSIIKPEALNIDSELIEDTTDISLEDVGDFKFSFDEPEPEKDKIDEILEASDNENESYEDDSFDTDEDAEALDEEDEINLDNILDEDDDIDNEDEESDENRGLAALQLQQMLMAQQNSPPAQEEKDEDEINIDNILDEDDDIEEDEDEQDNLDDILNEDDEDTDEEDDDTDEEDDDTDEDLSAFLKQVNAVKQATQTDNKINKAVAEIPKQQEEVKQTQVEKVEAVNINNNSTKEKELELEAEKLKLEREKLELENKRLELEKLKAEQELARFKDMDIQEIIRKAQEEALKKLQESQVENKESNIEKENKVNVNLEQKIKKPIQEKVEKKAEVTKPKQVVEKPKQVVKKEVTPIKSHNIVDNIDDEVGKVTVARPVQEVHQENKNQYAIYDNMAMDSLSATVKKYMIANGVKLKPISEETLNNKFGKHNIKKLIRASYLISTGKGITMGI